jgi:DNA-binding IclR family transcriptional regulator
MASEQPRKRKPARAQEDEGGEGSRSVRRAMDILSLMLARGGPMTVAHIIAELGIPKSTDYELVRTLGEADYIAHSSRGAGLFIGRRLYELGMAYRNNVDLLCDGAQIVDELRDETGETVQLSVLDNQLMMVVLKEEGRGHLRIISNVGTRVPLNWAAAGRFLVSDLPDEDLTRLLKATIRQSPTGKAIMNVAKLIAQISKARRLGYVTELNEANAHAGCIAAPIVDASGHCIAAISVVVPEQRLTKPHRDRLLASVTAAAERLSRRLG